MFKILFRKEKQNPNKEVVSEIISQTSELIQNLHNQMDLRFREISSQIKELETGLTQLENKLLSKDLKDKQAYGLLHYKINESRRSKTEDDVPVPAKSIQVK
jgi:hypothetical protein